MFGVVESVVRMNLQSVFGGLLRLLEPGFHAQRAQIGEPERGLGAWALSLFAVQSHVVLASTWRSVLLDLACKLHPRARPTTSPSGSCSARRPRSGVWTSCRLPHGMSLSHGFTELLAFRFLMGSLGLRENA